ncbi:MAG: class I SAM-dependent methyltransferase [Opitutaceae bacterium]|nr:class I SAM-dependent methyltransferase [Cephaloticoccus sp.]MCP5531083.1 class I SAM-dependent methyltransferase [Opitutaceae bacterium]
MPSPSYDSWINGLPQWHGLTRISPERAYAHAEDQYDAQYGVSAAEPEEGQGLVRLLQREQVDVTGPALEIGCGTGRLTYGLAHYYPGSDFLITDPSPTFLRITASQFPAGPVGPAQLQFALLNADDLGKLPPEMFSLIAMRSTLHHILQVDEFIAACARTLRPGGALAMGAEPLESGYVLMAAVAQSILPTLKSAGVTINPAWETQLTNFTDTVKFYCRRDLVKVAAEDKHLFTIHDLSDLGHRHGLRLQYFPNATYADFAPDGTPEFESFSVFFLTYLKYCMQFDEELLKHIRRHMQPQLKFIDECHRSHAGPAITGVFLFHKAGAAA